MDIVSGSLTMRSTVVNKRLPYLPSIQFLRRALGAWGDQCQFGDEALELDFGSEVSKCCENRVSRLERDRFHAGWEVLMDIRCNQRLPLDK